MILIVLLLGIYIYKIIQSNKQGIKLGYEQGVSIVQQLQEKSINIEKNEAENQDTLVIPIEDDSNYSGEYNFNIIVNNKYYYNQLDDIAKIIYDSIEDNLASR